MASVPVAQAWSAGSRRRPSKIISRLRQTARTRRPPDSAAVEASAAIALATMIRGAEWPGWEVLAADVHGLPRAGRKTAGTSHGTWARHQACGLVTKLGPGSVDCPRCGPASGSRTHLARRGDPCLLYLVVHRRWQKFGVGDQRRVSAHLRGGAQVVQVLRASFAEVGARRSHPQAPVSPADRRAGQARNDQLVRPGNRGNLPQDADQPERRSPARPRRD